MDAIDITSPDSPFVIDDSDQPEDISFGKEIAKNFVTATATSAGVFGGFVVLALAAPAVKRWFDRKKNPTVVEGESTVTDAPEKN